jgi:hypothetical protein
MGKEVKSGCYEKFLSPKLFEEEKYSIFVKIVKLFATQIPNAHNINI